MRIRRTSILFRDNFLDNHTNLRLNVRLSVLRQRNHDAQSHRGMRCQIIDRDTPYDSMPKAFVVILNERCLTTKRTSHSITTATLTPQFGLASQHSSAAEARNSGHAITQEA